MRIQLRKDLEPSSPQVDFSLNRISLFWAANRSFTAGSSEICISAFVLFSSRTGQLITSPRHWSYLKYFQGIPDLSPVSLPYGSFIHNVYLNLWEDAFTFGCVFVLERSMCSGTAELSRQQCFLESQDLIALYARSFFSPLNNFNGTETLRLFFLLILMYLYPKVASFA